MGYTVIARKYRPMIFEEIVGQEHVTRTLTNALAQNRVAHAYIFSGPRGVGKTTTARILAKAVNCEKYPTVNPCNECESCLSITRGNSMDVIEIDGASNRGIDEVRNIRDAIRYAPARSRMKIYIIDEVHMLTRDAFNALLKTLEEPPAHAMFIFATTEIHKVPLTILSRCQRYDFKRIPVQTVQQRLAEICREENIQITDEALFLIARKGDGSMRDAQSLLDQVISYTEGEITATHVRQLLGMIDEDLFFQMTDVLASRNTPGLLHLAREILSSGHDISDFLLQLEEHLRNLLVAQVLGHTEHIDAADVYRQKYLENKSQFTEDQLISMLNILAEYEPRIRGSVQPELLFEIVLLKLLKATDLISLDKVLALISSIKKAGGKVELPEEWSGSETPPAPAPVKTGTGHHTTSSHQEKKTAGNLTVETIREQWNSFLSFIEQQKNKKMIKTYLALYYPYQLTAGTLTLAIDVSSSSSFIRSHLTANRKDILQWINEFFGPVKELKMLEMNFKDEGIDWLVMSKEQLFELLKEKNANIRLIDDLFDLDVMDQ